MVGHKEKPIGGVGNDAGRVNLIKDNREPQRIVWASDTVRHFLNHYRRNDRRKEAGEHLYEVI